MEGRSQRLRGGDLGGAETSPCSKSRELRLPLKSNTHPEELSLHATSKGWQIHF